MKTMDLANGAKGAARSAQPEATTAAEAKCYVWDARGNGSGWVSPTLTGDHENRVTDYTAICVGNGQLHQTDMGEKTGALNCMHDQQAVIHAGKPPRKYIVRRLTPLECNRLQGFPDGWGIPDHMEDMTDREMLFWSGVRCEHADAMGKQTKTFKSRDALIKWYNGLHTDSAEYKMWGNGIALPSALYCMQGIVDAMNATEEDASSA